ncbi:MAG: type II secretion system protein [Elusimicrobiota bacterium]
MRPRNCKGFTLVETLVAVLLIAIVVTSVFSLALTSKGASVKTGRREQALFYTRKAMEKLKAYVTGDETFAAAGPNYARDPGRPWAIPEDACGGCGGAGQCWALDPTCTHDLTLMLPAKLRDAPISMTLGYAVTNDPPGCVDRTGLSACRKEVRFTVNWSQ